MKMSTLFKQLAVGVGFSTVLVGSAMAGTLITSFDYTQEFEFVNPITPASVNKEGTTSTLDDVDGYTKLSWGTESNSFDKISSLVINPEALDRTTPSGNLSQGTVTTATDINAMVFELGPMITHNNFVITGSSLTSASAQDNVILTPFGGGVDQTQAITFGVLFEETPNAQNPCSSGAVNSFGCGDIFVLSGGLLGIPTIVNNTELAFLIDSFVRDGYLYQVFLNTVSGALGQLSDLACAEAGADSGCIGFTTFENQSNSFQLQFAMLATEQIPEPATIGLLAGSLLLMGWVRRKKVNGLSA
tara:strand:+ start:102869 stop:103774 length:906 start_codon:yes stop_codon:yes gene_type:complete